MDIKAKLISCADIVVLKAACVLWKMMKVFDPYPLQAHYAAMKPVKHIEVSKCFSLKGDDAVQHIARLSNVHIGSATGNGRTGLVGRKGLIKIHNLENGRFLMVRAQGSAPGSAHVPRDGIALNYDARKALGITGESQLTLVVGPANLGDQEFYNMYQDPDASSRTARALGWYLAIGGIVYSCFQMALSVLEPAVAMIPMALSQLAM